MKRKLLSLLMVLGLLLGMLPQLILPAFAASYSGSCGIGVTWNLDTDSGLLTISGAERMYPYGKESSNAPWFPHRELITAVQIRDGVLGIGAYAFYSCKNMKSVTLPDSVTFIEEGAFDSCSALTQLELPETLKTIGYGAFFECVGLTSIRVPASVMSLGSATFFGCTGLKEVTLEDGLIHMETNAFGDCTSLTSVQIPDSVVYLTPTAFRGCSKLTSVLVQDSNPRFSNDELGLLYNKDKTELLLCPGGYKGSFSIPNSVNTVGSWAFIDCFALTGVNFHKGVTTIREHAFANCHGLKTVAIPAGVTEISDYAFFYCSGLTKVTIPNSVTRIGDHAFSQCISLPDISIPNSVTVIESAAFERCNSFIHVTIPEGVSEIKSIFFDNEKLKSVTIRNENPTVVDFAFLCCPELTDLYFLGNAPKVKDSPFPETVTLHYLEGAEGWTEPTWKGYKAVASKGFFDVQGTDYYSEPVAWALEQNITNGTSEGYFSPDRGCTRGQIVTFLWRAAGSPEPKGSTNPFADVSSNAYYYKAVLWAVENQITTGTGNGKFSPEATCTRGQVATFLWRAKGEPAPGSETNPFKDLNTGMYYFDAILWAVEKEITNGTGNGNFSPDNTCTRGQIVTFLYRAYH